MLSREVPDEPTRTAITQLAAQIEAEDGSPPLSEQALIQLGFPDVEHVLARQDSALRGYAQRAGDAAELTGAPEVLPALLDAIRTPGMLVWSHGTRSRLVALFEQHGLMRARELYQLRRPLTELPPDPPLAADITVRAFRPDGDDAAWLALNAAAFADHPEQGRWTQADLAARVAEPWFDAAGFLLAERDEQLLGFHWTKVHPDGTGEVYVLGVAPSAQGLGLGKALLIRGLRHLADSGCPEVLLYVDGDNSSAVRLYERAGFRRADLDIQWRVS